MKQDPDIPDRSYRSDIDGLRAVAVVSVILYHSGVPHISGGFTGVDIFFVISGYLIGGHIYSELRTGVFSYLSFYRRRAKRILPVFYTVLVFTIIGALLLLSPSEATEFGHSAFAATLSASNILFWKTASYFNPTNEFNPLLMTWSLGVEEQFYAVIPLFMVLLARIRHGFVLPSVLTICALSFLLSWLELSRHPTFVFYMLPARAWEMGVGLALTVAELDRKRNAPSGPLAETFGWTGAVLMLTPVFLLTKSIPFPGPAAVPSVLGAALILLTPLSWISRRVLSIPPLVYVGRISYSWYLWHWPLLSFFRIVSGNELSPASAFLAIAASLGAAVLSYHLVEQPFRKSARPAIPLLLRYAAVSFVTLAVCVGFTRFVPESSPKLSKAEEAVQSAMIAPCLAIHDEMNLTPPCYDPSDTRPSVALWGDSHSNALAPGLRSIAETKGLGFVQLAHSACLPLNGAAVYLPTDPLLARRCMTFNRKTLEIVEKDHRIQWVVLSGRWSDAFPQVAKSQWLTTDVPRQQEIPTPEMSNTIFVRSLTASIQVLLNAGKQVIVLEDVPNFDFDPIMKVRASYKPVRRVLAILIGAQDPTDTGFGPAALEQPVAIADSQLKKAVDGFPNVTLVDLKQPFCRIGKECAYRDGDRLLYLDSQHLTADGAFYALRDFQLPALSVPSE